MADIDTEFSQADLKRLTAFLNAYFKKLVYALDAQ